MWHLIAALPQLFESQDLVSRRFGQVLKKVILGLWCFLYRDLEFMGLGHDRVFQGNLSLLSSSITSATIFSLSLALPGMHVRHAKLGVQSTGVPTC